MGNATTNHTGDLQGIWVPVPLDDFDAAPFARVTAPVHTPVCRAAPGSADQGYTQMQGSKSHLHLPEHIFQDQTRDTSSKAAGEDTSLYDEDKTNFSQRSGPLHLEPLLELNHQP